MNEELRSALGRATLLLTDQVCATTVFGCKLLSRPCLVIQCLCCSERKQHAFDCMAYHAHSGAMHALKGTMAGLTVFACRHSRKGSHLL